ncbi:DUF1656 domain-containing protein [Variovorax sp. J22P168]|uniref:DUF1656 domain-containing protein n=1 Tax=Variovorax jilinensis TaxID=3053513 RepID=UPI002576F90E|nr:DUF1656 domain-containing protein [Variovorax sp. J22P168]MDM0015232.1 DUF1656 domain-containing protein [Variovorax sp. J22P168]
MIEDINLFGVFVNGALVTGALALLLQMLLRRALMSAGVYRHVWHTGLFDIALFVVLWGAVGFAVSSSSAALGVLLS